MLHGDAWSAIDAATAASSHVESDCNSSISKEGSQSEEPNGTLSEVDGSEEASTAYARDGAVNGSEEGARARARAAAAENDAVEEEETVEEHATCTIVEVLQYYPNNHERINEVMRSGSWYRCATPSC